MKATRARGCQLGVTARGAEGDCGCCSAETCIFFLVSFSEEQYLDGPCTSGERGSTRGLGQLDREYGCLEEGDRNAKCQYLQEMREYIWDSHLLYPTYWPKTSSLREAASCLANILNPVSFAKSS